MVEYIKDIASFGAAGAVVLVVWKMFDFLLHIKKKNNTSSTYYLRKDDHQRECDYKMSFIVKRLDNIDCKVDNLTIKMDNKYDEILKMLIKMNGGKKND